MLYCTFLLISWPSINDHFWKKKRFALLQVAREHYKTLKGNERMDLAKMAKELVQESAVSFSFKCRSKSWYLFYLCIEVNFLYLLFNCLSFKFIALPCINLYFWQWPVVCLPSHTQVSKLGYKFKITNSFSLF